MAIGLISGTTLDGLTNQHHLLAGIDYLLLKRTAKVVLDSIHCPGYLPSHNLQRGQLSKIEGRVIALSRD